MEKEETEIHPIADTLDLIGIQSVLFFYLKDAVKIDPIRSICHILKPLDNICAEGGEIGNFRMLTSSRLYSILTLDELIKTQRIFESKFIFISSLQCFGMEEMMNILAIIPARAGSVGIPNKNIRMINGRPLISYAIENAKHSRYITDIVISTDSEIIRLIAEQAGVSCHWRKEELCRDDVTLDAVIYDAIPKNRKWDYVVTLQPTSPTLSAETLDEAIEFAIKEQYDTVISVINAPHLSWREADGKFLPNYLERLNRQYLPANYVETGAFLIAKGSVITAKSRIGERVSVFEVPERESYDIDGFADLICAEYALSQGRTAIYVNGNLSRGTGHVYRALELADYFYTKPDIYYDKNQTDKSVFGDTKHVLIPVDGIIELFDRCRQMGYSLFINDILDTSVDYMLALRSTLPGARIVNFEDDGEGAEKADLVVNALYGSSTRENTLTGEQYYIPGKVFLLYEPRPLREHVEHILITFGGADPMEYTERLLRMIKQEKYRKYRFTVALGRSKANAEQIIKDFRGDNVEILRDVSDMAKLMYECDMAITSRGRTCYELAIMGVPTIVMAQNRREEKHGFASEENGFRYLGLDPENDVIEGALQDYLKMELAAREALREKMLAHDLRSGGRNVTERINSVTRRGRI